jgi:cell division protein FtsB
MTPTAIKRPRTRRPSPQALIVLLVVGLAGAMGITPTRELLAQRSRISGMASDLRHIKLANQELATQVARLNDPYYIEQQARRQFGLIRPGETSYVVVPQARKRSAKRTRPHVHGAGTPRPRSFFARLVHFVGLE